MLISRGRDSRLVEIPILPPYSETITAQMAEAIINSQELFLLAHELGRYFIDQNLLHLFGENTLDKTQIIFQLILISEKRFKSLTDEQKNLCLMKSLLMKPLIKFIMKRQKKQKRLLTMVFFII